MPGNPQWSFSNPLLPGSWAFSHCLYLEDYHRTTLFKHFIGLFTIYGISSLCMWSLNLSVVFPFLITRDLDLAGLNFILAHVATTVSAVSIHLACMWLEVVNIKSSIKPVLDGRYIPDCVLGPRVSRLVELISKFIPMVKRTAETVHPVTMRFSNFCRLVILSPTLNRSLIPSR